jgi:hypothetical protein
LVAVREGKSDLVSNVVGGLHSLSCIRRCGWSGGRGRDRGPVLGGCRRRRRRLQRQNGECVQIQLHGTLYVVQSSSLCENVDSYSWY